MTPTKSQLQALEWLRRHNGDGCFDKNGVVLAGGELAPFMRATWNALRDLGAVEMYSPGGAGRRGRIRVVSPFRGADPGSEARMRAHIAAAKRK